MTELRLSRSRLREVIRSVFQFRIKTWHTAMRGWDENNIRVVVCLEDRIWYWVLLEWLWGKQAHICGWMDYFTLPKFIRNWKRAWDDEEDTLYRFEECYGSTLNVFWHLVICEPFGQWVFKNSNYFGASPDFELTLAEAKAKFSHDPDVWEWIEKELASNKQYDEELAAGILAAEKSKNNE